MTNQSQETDENKLRWEFIERATKEIETWPLTERAEIHPERFCPQSEGETPNLGDRQIASD